MFFSSDNFLVWSLSNQRSIFLIRQSLWGPATRLVVDVLKKIHCVVCSDISMTWEANLCCLQRNMKNNKRARRYLCHMCYLKLFELCNENDNICENVFQMPVRLSSVFYTKRERKRKGNEDIRNWWFRHTFRFKKAPQNCKSRKYHVSNYVPSRQKLC